MRARRGRVQHRRGSRLQHAPHRPCCWRCATPTRRTNSRMAAAGTPRRRMPGERRHARIVPAGDVPSRTSSVSMRLRQHGVADVQPGELVLLGTGRHRQILDQPVVQRPVVLEFQRADRVGDALDRVRLAVRKIVGRVDAPGVAGARMRRHAGCGTAPDRACSCCPTPCRSWRAARARRWGTRRRACGGTGRGSPPTERSRYGLSRPGSVSVPRIARISSGGGSST